MTKSAFACRPDDHANVAAQIMWDHDCGCVPVVDGDRRVIGVVTDRDLCMAAHTQGRLMTDIPVREVMAKKIITCTPDTTLAAAEHLMREAKVRRLPVVDKDGKLEGIVSLNDLALEANSDRVRSVRGTSLEQVGTTLAAICDHRPHAREAAA